jgi:O-antigen/teichoic acid export membrane protein
VTESRAGKKAVSGGLAIAVAMGVMNVATYSFQILCSNLLGPSRYSEFAAVMAVLLVISVLALGLQATAARRVASAPDHVEQIEKAILRVGYRCALALGLLCLVLTPVIDRLLRLEGFAIAALIAVAAVPLTVVGAQSGVLQGEQRWHALSLVYLSMGLGRLIFGAVGLLIQRDTLGAVAGMAVGAFVPMVIGWLALRSHERDISPAGVPASSLLRELAHNSHALLAFFALTNADILIARATLDDHQSGLYAAGLLMTKAVLFLPQFVIVAAFPAMSKPNASHRVHLLGLGLVLGIGVITTLGVFALPDLAVLFVGGKEYDALANQIWAFAFLGTLLAMIQLMVYSVLARQHQRMVFFIWAALAALIAMAPLVDTRTFLLTTVIVIDTALLAVFVIWLVASKPERAPAPDLTPAPSPG